MSRTPDDREGLSPSLSSIMDILDDGDEFDDDIYEPATEESTDQYHTELDEDEDDEEDEDEDDEFLDAHEDVITIDGAEILGEIMDANMDDEDDEGEDTEADDGRPRADTNNPRTTTTTTITLRELNELLGRHAAIRRLFSSTNLRGFGLEIDDDDEDYGYGLRRRRPRKTPLDPNRFPKVPNDNGRALMHSGVYGNTGSHVDTRRRRRRTIHERLLWRRLGLEPRSSARMHNRMIAQEMVPATNRPDRIIHYDSRAYSGQFSDDGNFFFSCTQNFKVRMYDTSNPFDWKFYKMVEYPYGQWTITDATLSPDNKFLAYSSIRHQVCLAPTDPSDHSDHTLLDFTNYSAGATEGDPRFGYMGRPNGFGIWSLRFSGDGREIVAGTSDSAVLVYDLETRKTVLKLAKHTDDVNAVCFGDKSSPHILYSGSDDQTLRVWDRRSMADRREAGVFVGHTEGLTYIDSKGDGRYVLSNGKDQMMKLWDLRKMVSPNDFSQMNLAQYTTNFDYRFSPYDEDEYEPNPKDCSVVTFRGHRVLKTLIRCHFSPPGSSNSRYVYTGSEDGHVWIYNMDGTVKAKIDVQSSTKDSRTRSNDALGYGYDMNSNNTQSWKTCVRDASWSPTAPMIAATSWNGWGMSTGTVSAHTWNDSLEDDEGDPPMGTGYNQRLDRREELNARSDVRGQGGQTDRSSTARSLRSRAVRPRRYNRVVEGDEDDDEADGW